MVCIINMTFSPELRDFRDTLYHAHSSNAESVKNTEALKNPFSHSDNMNNAQPLNSHQSILNYKCNRNHRT